MKRLEITRKIAIKILTHLVVMAYLSKLQRAWEIVKARFPTYRKTSLNVGDPIKTANRTVPAGGISAN